MIDPKLYTLLAVVNNKNYTRAAEELSFTQPAVTQHIKQIEKELHVKIFNRVDNELKPTQEGAIVIEFARRTIALYEKMKQNLIFEKNNLRHFVVGVTLNCTPCQGHFYLFVLGNVCLSTLQLTIPSNG